MDDERITELFFARSEEALTETAAKYGKGLSRLAYNITGSDRDAEECVNDAYLGLWNSIPPERPRSLFAYAAAIIRNIALAKVRANTAKKRGRAYEKALDELEDALFSRSAEDEAEADAIGDAINDFLSRLDAEGRVMFVRRYYFADSVKDIAKRLDMTETAVSVKLHRIRARLKQQLYEKGFRI